MKILLDDKENVGSRKVVEVELVEERASSFTVRLPDGNVIKRKKVRDIPKEA